MARFAPRLYDPFRWNGLRIGLLGGSFNPPHQGHVHASLTAMKYLDLDAVWWLVSPGNPLKSKVGLPSLEKRVEACRNLTRHPGIIVSDIERDLGTIRTFQTISGLKSRFPRTRFVWLSGTDIASEFHRWYRWQDLMGLLPFAFIGRPTESGLVRQNVLKQTKDLHHIIPNHGIRLDLDPGHIFWLFGEPLNPLSSTSLRSEQDPG
jgi:nicotinate-nucleotide adenylyltransferase